MTDESTPNIPTGAALSPLNPEYQKDPVALLDRVREADRVVFDPTLVRYIVSRFDDVYAILSDRELGVDPRKAKEGTFTHKFLPREEGREPTMLFLDPPDHTRLRALVSKAFTARAIEKMRGRIEEIANELLDKVDPAQPFDLIATFCQPYPTIIITEMLGVDPADQAAFTRWTDDALAVSFDLFASDEMKKRAQAAHTEMRTYLRNAVAERRAAPRADLITGLLQAEAEGSFFNDAEIVSMIALLIGAGNGTMSDMLGSGMKNLLEHPEQAQMLRDDPSLIPNAVEEMLRFEGPVTFSGRITVDNRPIAGCPMGPGESVTLSLAGANYDPRVHQDPHKFDVTREKVDHLSFGGGRRHCLGAPLARLEAQIAVRTLLHRFPKLRLEKQEYLWKRSAGMRGLERLMVVG